MQQFRNVLVGVRTPELGSDGQPTVDPPTAAAVRQALELGERSGCSITLLCGLVPPVGLLMSEEKRDSLIAVRKEEADAALARYVASLNSEGIDIRHRVVVGQPWVEICRAVQTEGFDLVMAGTRNVGPLSRLLFGGTGLRLLRNCPSPVWIVRPRDVDEEKKAILVATQLDEVGQRALAMGVLLARQLDARLHVMHVLDVGPARRMGMIPAEMEDYRQQLRQQREQQLQEQLAQTDSRATPHGVQVHLVEGRPYLVVLDAIDEFAVDLLIMGTSGRGGLPGVLVGNTAEHLLSEIPCSLLAIKPDDFRSPVATE